ncbi:MAG TPA: permease [Chlorobium sp.]|uniref:Permease n=1 Tax=Chlorobium phaeovibrioides (strain DSM 265 / 1930) TaxID=290318 RepID=A4SFL8_CHLPM|nr:permease [Chlorobium sp.]
MNEFIAILISVFVASWHVLVEAAPWMLLGFVVAGLFRALLPGDMIAKHMGGRGIKGIVTASALGIPVPLCSCGVLPAAAGLRKQGAGRGPVASFLISTPETGVDSIAVTYALLDPLMTVIRPLVSFVTAIAAGVSVAFFERFEKPSAVVPEAGQATGSCCGGTCSSSAAIPEVPQSFIEKVRGGLRFAFSDLLADIGKWFFLGLLLAGCISVFVSPDMLQLVAGNEFLSMLMMLAISVPLYVCATASTPVAAALALKGISPGAALVFLLAGPATNAASLTVISRMLGKASTAVYLVSIMVMSLVAGILVNRLYRFLGLDLTGWVGRPVHTEPSLMAMAAAVVLILLTLRAMLFKGRAEH